MSYNTFDYVCDTCNKPFLNSTIDFSSDCGECLMKRRMSFVQFLHWRISGGEWLYRLSMSVTDGELAAYAAMPPGTDQKDLRLEELADRVMDDTLSRQVDAKRVADVKYLEDVSDI
jgi:hypothetical protein